MTRETVSAAAQQLRTINQKIGDKFVVVCDSLAPLSGQEMQVFADDCLAIADSGWRSFEPLNILLAAASELQASGRLLSTSQRSRQLSGYSYEPVQAYLNFATEHQNDLEHLEPLELLGLSLHQQYQHASSLMTAYFNAAGRVLGCGDEDIWSQLVLRMAAEGRDHLQELFKLSGEQPRWGTAVALSEHSVENCLIYLREANQLSGLYGEQVGKLESLIGCCSETNDMKSLLAALTDVALFERGDRKLLLELALSLPDSDAVASFLSHAQLLPLDRPSVVSQWLDQGIDEMSGNAQALLAYLSHESMRSQQVLQSIRGEVCLADHQRTFDLLVEALSARRVMIEAIDAERGGEQGVEQFRQDQFVSFSQDAKTIFLPEKVNLFDDTDDNFAFYKVSIFHQIGFSEFGCFDAIDRVAETLRGFDDEKLAHLLFQIVEDARVDWQLERKYPGLAPQLLRIKQLALLNRAEPLTLRVRLLEILIRAGLSKPGPILADTFTDLSDAQSALRSLLFSLAEPNASIDDALTVTSQCYELITGLTREGSSLFSEELSALDKQAAMTELPEPVSFRGEVEVEEVARSLKIEALVEALQEETDGSAEDPGIQMPGAPDEQLELGDLEAGEVSEGVSMILTELQRELDAAAETPDAGDGKGVLEFLGGLSSRTREASKHRYDEWDYGIADYRAGWCTLFEHRELDEDLEYFRKTLIDNQDLSKRIRHQLNKVRPEMLRKVKGVIEGEELDLERSISYVVDRKVGLTPDETIYVQRQRRERDVSTLFLLDMSASTDDIVPDPDRTPPPAPELDDDDEYLVRYFEQHKAFEAEAKRIIDLEKASVILMAEALESLGDAYSVCGFSGYGRDQVDYYLCKDFDEAFTTRTQAKIGGIKPCRSTRMGAPIRHATRRLMETGSRIKALIIISDGYPQDHDYGADRNSRDYGLNDTMKALSEAKQQGVLSYCLTVDPSGHDYLRAMCPDSQYMVIQDINQLPEELSRVYRSLTG